MDILYSPRSISSKGSFAQLKNDFCHKAVAGAAMQCFNHLEDFLYFSTSAQVTYLALKMMAVPDVQGEWVPAELPQDKRTLLTAISDAIVKQVWAMPDASEIEAVLDAETDMDKWCSCDECNSDKAFYCNHPPNMNY